MSFLTLPALLTLLQTQQCVLPAMVPIIAGRALTENATLDTRVVHVNPNGTVDAGLLQINSINWHWTGLDTEAARFDPCKSAHAAQMIDFRNYNGNPPPAVRDQYVARTEAMIRKVAAISLPVPDIPLAPNHTTWNPLNKPTRMSRDTFYANKRKIP